VPGPGEGAAAGRPPGPVVTRRRVLGGTLAGAGALVMGGIDSGCGGGPAATASAAPAAPTSLTVDGMPAPIGLAPDDVFFAWHVGDDRRGAIQQAYRIVVSRAVGGARPGDGGAGATAMVWDSGQVLSSQQAFVAYAGPRLTSDAAYRWTVQTWSASGGPGPFAAHGSFETGLGDGDWRARWIGRVLPEGPGPDEYAFARREFTLSAAPVSRARAYVSGDQQYELYVNGTRAGKGQAYSFPDSQYYETLDVTGLLRPGARNVLAVVTSWQGATKGHPAGAPAFIAQLSVVHAGGQRTVLVSDGSWRVRAGPWRAGSQRDLEGDKVDFTENIDGPDIPVGWLEPGFDDRAWEQPDVRGPAGTSPWRRLVPVRTRIVEEPVAPVSLTTLASGAVVADFGRVYAAVPTVTFRAGQAGRTVPMRAGYELDEPGGQVSQVHGTQHTDMSYSYVQRGGGTEVFHPFDYLGFRYFQIDGPGEAVAPPDVVARTRHTWVLDDHAATFSSSSAVVDAIFELGRHSALFTAQEQFIDTPTREKGPWLWDGFNESQTAMAAFGEQNLTRKSLLEFAQSQGRYWPNGAVNKIYPTGLGALDINEFTEIYPEWVWQYFMHTGDVALLASVYPVVANLAGYVASSLDPHSGLVSDLPSTDIYYSFPVVTRMNVLGINVFRRAGDIAAALGRPGSEVGRHRRRQTQLTAAVNRRLTHDGLYVQGVDNGGAQVPVSQDPNACALAYGVVPNGRTAAVAAYVASQGMGVAVRTATEVLRALGATGRTADMMRILTDASQDGWAKILALGGTFTWEVWEPSDANGDSMSHGWGSNVLVEIQRWLLGVTPTSPGYATLAVAPPGRGLEQATGTVPTPRGPVTVDWSYRAGGGGFSLDLTVPPNATATVRLPAASTRAVREGGRPLSSGTGVRIVSSGGGVAVVHVGAGHFQFESTL
jgi:alpha-L-rhamnosidase